MDDLISRKALLEIINSQLVPDGIAESFAGRALCRIIASAPIVDAVPVVRCKDCKHRGNPEECLMCYTEVEPVEGGQMYSFHDLTKPYGYCHRGVKIVEKEDAHAAD